MPSSRRSRLDHEPAVHTRSTNVMGRTQRRDWTELNWHGLVFDELTNGQASMHYSGHCLTASLTYRDYAHVRVNQWPVKVKVKVKVVNLYSASSCTTYTSNALFVTNQSRRSHSRRVQPANTGWRTGQPGSPVSCTKVPTFRNPYNGLLLI